MDFIIGWLTGWIFLLLCWMVYNTNEHRKECKQYEIELQNRKLALEKEVREGRMKTDGNGAYWSVYDYMIKDDDSAKKLMQERKSE